MNNNASMNGARTRHQIILSLITGTKLCSRSQCQQDFVPSVESLGKIIPWMFALDHYHFVRWMIVHVQDLLALKNTCPTTHDIFVTQKNRHRFSELAHDQLH